MARFIMLQNESEDNAGRTMANYGGSDEHLSAPEDCSCSGYRGRGGDTGHEGAADVEVDLLSQSERSR